MIPPAIKWMYIDVLKDQVEIKQMENETSNDGDVYRVLITFSDTSMWMLYLNHNWMYEEKQTIERYKYKVFHWGRLNES